MNTQLLFAICQQCSYRIEFEVPVEEVGCAIKYQCPACQATGWTPGVSPEEIAMAFEDFRDELVEVVPEPEPVAEPRSSYSFRTLMQVLTGSALIAGTLATAITWSRGLHWQALPYGVMSVFWAIRYIHWSKPGT